MDDGMRAGEPRAWRAPRPAPSHGSSRDEASERVQTSPWALPRLRKWALANRRHNGAARLIATGEALRRHLRAHADGMIVGVGRAAAQVAVFETTDGPTVLT